MTIWEIRDSSFSGASVAGERPTRGAGGQAVDSVVGWQRAFAAGVPRALKPLGGSGCGRCTTVPRVVVCRWTVRWELRWMEQEAHWRWGRFAGTGREGLGKDGQRDEQRYVTVQYRRLLSGLHTSPPARKAKSSAGPPG